MESGSSVKFTWVINNLEKFPHEGESYSVVFKKTAEYKLKVSYSICLYGLSCSLTFCFFKYKNPTSEFIAKLKYLTIFLLGNSFQPCELPEPANPPDCC